VAAHDGGDVFADTLLLRGVTLADRGGIGRRPDRQHRSQCRDAEYGPSVTDSHDFSPL
jgi:hypothetical protein